MALNPLVLLWSVLWGVFILLHIQSLNVVIGLALVMGGYLYGTRRAHPDRIRRIKPFLFFLPLWMVIYVLFSMVFSEFTWRDLLTNSMLITLRFVCLLLLMSWYLSRSGSGDIIRAARSLWARSGRSWPWVDDAFLFIELVLRFFPQFAREWRSVKRARQSIGLVDSGSRRMVIRRSLNDLPGLFLRVYSQADATALTMIQRGYGRRHPRAVLQPVPWTLRDSLVAVGIPLVLLIVWMNGAV